MKAAELRKLGEKKLNEELFSTLREQFNLRMQLATNQLTQVHNLRKARRSIARIKTVLHEKNG